MLHSGLYEQVINNALTGELAEIPEARKSVAPIDKAEASKVLAQYLADVVQKGLDNVLDNGGDISAQIGLTNQIVELIQNTTQEADCCRSAGKRDRVYPQRRYRSKKGGIVLQSALRRCASFARKHGENGSGHQRPVPACGGASSGCWLEAQRHDPAQWSHHPAGQHE